MKRETQKMTWEEKRIQCMRGFTVVASVLGAEYSMTYTTCWAYIDQLIKMDASKDLYYSLIQSIYFISGIMFSLVICRGFDKHRKTRSNVHCHSHVCRAQGLSEVDDYEKVQPTHLNRSS